MVDILDSSLSEMSSEIYNVGINIKNDKFVE